MSAYMRFTSQAVFGHDAMIAYWFSLPGTDTRCPAGAAILASCVPVDGDVADASTFIRWDELTRNGELIAAKHILFLMDACIAVGWH